MQLQIFENAEFGAVRTVTVDGIPFFVGKDVAVALGYSNSSKAVASHVDEEDKVFLMLDIADAQNGNVPIGQSKTAVINESGLYSLIMGSKLPTAKRFKRWVTSEVLPSIRKHGVYAVDEMLDNPDILIAALEELKAERNRVSTLTETIAVQHQQISEMKPKSSKYDVVLNCKDLVAISTISKDYGWSATRMNDYLHSKGIQYKQSSIWLLYQKYAECGYTSTKTHSYNGNDGTPHTKIHTYWTQKGRLFIYETLKADGIVPLIEKEEI
jgi:prophage antirepressor-like protein